MKVIFSQKAKQSLADIYHYIAVVNQAPENAEKFIDELTKTANDLLSLFPNIGAKANKTTRYIVHKKYVITYRVKKEEVLITGIYRGQNWRKV